MRGVDGRWSQRGGEVEGHTYFREGGWGRGPHEGEKEGVVGTIYEGLGRRGGKNHVRRREWEREMDGLKGSGRVDGTPAISQSPPSVALWMSR